MPPKIALLLCLIFILYTFWYDLKSNKDFPKSIFIPLIWMFISGSRFVSKWINMSPSLEDAYLEGSPIDAVIFSMLIGAAIIILARRKIDWKFLILENKVIAIYFFYCFLSILWSDYSFIAFKRLIKEFGVPLMALILLTEKKPIEAIGIILKRLAILWIPLSIVFYKYYPSLGRAFAPDGRMFATGVSQGKNGLGILCLLVGIYFAWKYIIEFQDNRILSLQDKAIDFLIIILIGWLLYLSKSATALACLAFSISLLLICRTKIFSIVPERIITFIAIGFPIFFVLDYTLDLRNMIYGILGRDATLTTRVFIWDYLLDMDSDILLGSGYQSFWLGERLQEIWAFTGRTINQAHNGYIEIYLNLGLIGVSLLLSIILSGLINIRKKLEENFQLAVLSLCFVLVAVLYNYTEALFHGINNVWLLTLYGLIYIPGGTNIESEK
jgi:O-antigen ligase